MYQIRCDDYILYDPRDDELCLLNPKCKLEVNTVGEGSFTIQANHPYYSKIQRLKSIFEIRQDSDVIFRGRMTNDGGDFHNQISVDLEGVLGFANDSIISPFDFPAQFPDATKSKNIVEYFLSWLISEHNAQVEEWQRFKLGVVTVSDPNNYITRSSTAYASTWETFKSKLFDSALGGYLVIRYEADGNYIDYLAAFTETNEQKITFGENLLDLDRETDATETYSAILPQGASIEDASGNKEPLTIESLPDGNITDDIVKKGKFIYSKSAVAQYGWICVPVKESKWTDVTLPENLRSKGVEALEGGMMLSNTITVKAADMNFSERQIQSFRIYKNIVVDSPRHGLIDAKLPLTKLSIEILKPQNTKITIGDTVRSLVGMNTAQGGAASSEIDSVSQDIANSVSNSVMSSVNSKFVEQEEALGKTLEGYATKEELAEMRAYFESKIAALHPEIEPDPDEPSSYSVTNSLTNCSTDNTAETIGAGESYSATITADNGYSLNSVTVKMGGSDITAFAWTLKGSSNGTVSIDTVTGDIVITATAQTE